MSQNGPTPVLLLGGQENALSVVRSLTRRGVPVSLSATETCWALRSRHCARRYPIETGVNHATFWDELLLGSSHQYLRGSVIFPCDDDAIEYMAARHTTLSEHYLLDDHLPDQQTQLLDKRVTLDLARSVGVPTPSYWKIVAPEDVDAIEGRVEFPVLIKPLHSHRFQRVYNKKLLLANNFSDLVKGVKEALDFGLEIMVCEFVPGPDAQLSSYYTYIDANGDHLFELTKRVIRRSPVNFGGGCYHMTDRVPEAAAAGRKFFRGIDFRGLGNIEFKLDQRDGQLKVIECNARFTAAQELLSRAGVDSAWIMYNHVTGRPVPKTQSYREGLRLWYPTDDFDGFRDLRRRGELSFIAWLRSIAHPQVFPFFALDDPLPALIKGRSTFRRRILRRLPFWPNRYVPSKRRLAK